MDRLAARPILALSVFAIVGILLIGGEIYRVVSTVSANTAREAAISYSAAISAIREYYSSVVVPRAKEGGAVASHDYRDLDGAVPLPATLTIELGEKVSRQIGGGTFRLFSNYPFPWRSNGGPRDEFERNMLEMAKYQEKTEFYEVEDTADQRFLRYAIPVRMKQSCVDCHNRHPQSPRTDWQVGDVRGVQSVRLPMPDISLLANFSHLGMFVLCSQGCLAG